jgi:hypothetical protein
MAEPARRMYRYEVPIDDVPHAFGLTSEPVAVAVRVLLARGAPASESYDFAEFWAEHTEGAPQAKRWFQVFGTGQPLPPGAKWTGTCPRTAEGFVWHLFEIPAGDQ